MTIKNKINQELNYLTEEQLKQVADFITFLQFQQRLIKPITNREKLAKLYEEFAQEDHELAEMGMNEYEQLLNQEDQL